MHYYGIGVIRPFVMKHKDSGYKAQEVHKGGDNGNREGKINELIMSLI